MYRTAVDVGRLNRPNSYELRNLRRRLPEPRQRRPCLHGRLPEITLEQTNYGTRGQLVRTTRSKSSSAESAIRS